MNYQIPATWISIQLNELANDISYGYTAKSDNISGDAKMLRITDIQNGKVEWSNVPYCQISIEDFNKYKIQKGDLVFARTGATVGKSHLLRDEPPDSVFASYLIRVRPKNYDLSRYLSHYFWSVQYWGQITDFSAGIGQPNVNGSKLKTLIVPVPPEAEQTRIADKLDTVLSRVDAVNARLARVAPLLKRFRQSVLAAATSGRLTEDWRQSSLTRDQAQTLLQAIQSAKLDWCTSHPLHNEQGRILRRARALSSKESSDELPDGWLNAKLEDIVLMVVDCHNKTAPYSESGIPLIRTTNVRNGQLEWQDIRYVDEETYSYWSRRCLPEPGDLIFTREAPMGEVAIIPEGQRVCLGQRTMLLRPLADHVSANFLRISIMSPGFKSFSESIAVGSGVKHLRVGDVSDLQVALPSRAEQTEIVRRVETLFAFADRLEARLKAAQTAAQRLTPAVLAKAFRGELVPQDPADEPAAELLKRLAAQREAEPKARRGRRAGAEA